MSYAMGLAPVAVLGVVAFLLVSCSIRTTADGGPSSRRQYRGHLDGGACCQRMALCGTVCQVRGADGESGRGDQLGQWDDPRPGRKPTLSSAAAKKGLQNLVAA